MGFPDIGFTEQISGTDDPYLRTQFFIELIAQPYSKIGGCVYCIAYHWAEYNF